MSNDLAPVTKAELDSAEKAARTATPGAWRIEEDRNEQPCIYASSNCDDLIALLPHQCVTSIKQQRDADAVHIATASPAFLLRLIADLRRERTAREKAERERDEARVLVERGTQLAERAADTIAALRHAQVGTKVAAAAKALRRSQ